MGMTSEGTVSIPFIELWEIVWKHVDSKVAEIQYGVPCVNTQNDTLDIDFAAATEGHPKDWMAKPKAFVQWEKLSEMQRKNEKLSTLIKILKEKIGVDEEGIKALEELKGLFDGLSFLFR